MLAWDLSVRRARRRFAMAFGDGTYSVPYHCNNCGHGWNEHFPIGMSAPGYGVRCPNCGNRGGEKRIWSMGRIHTKYDSAYHGRFVRS